MIRRKLAHRIDTIYNVYATHRACFLNAGTDTKYIFLVCAFCALSFFTHSVLCSFGYGLCGFMYVCVSAFLFFLINIFFDRFAVRLAILFFPRLFSVFFDSLALFSQLLLVFLLLPHMYRSYDVLYFRFAMYILNRAINFNISMLSWSLLVFRCALWIFNIFICATCS